MPINIFICGVGGQGIGLMGDVLCETLVREGQQIMATETHGVAQRGGIVSTHIRIGPGVRTPKICGGEADFVFALERLEGVRFAQSMLRPGGRLVFYDTVLQPQPTRSRGVHYPDDGDMALLRERWKIQIDSIYLEDLPGPQMQNVALLGRIAALHAVQGVTPESIRKILAQLLPKKILEMNLKVFDTAVQYQPTASKARGASNETHSDRQNQFQKLRAFPIVAGT